MDDTPEALFRGLAWAFGLEVAAGGVTVGKVAAVNEIESYHKVKEAYEAAQKWVDMIGRPLHGAEPDGAMMGHVTRVVGYGPAAPEIYWQSHPGAASCHPCPDAFARHLDAVIRERLPELVKDALARHRREVAKAAMDAVAEANRIIEDAQGAL